MPRLTVTQRVEQAAVRARLETEARCVQDLKYRVAEAKIAAISALAEVAAAQAKTAYSLMKSLEALSR